MCIVVIYIWKFPLGLSSGYRLGRVASALCGDIWQTAGKAGWISNISMDGSGGQVLGVDCIMKWIYWCESISRPLLVNMQSVSITFDKLGLRPFALFVFYQLHLAITIKDSRWCIVNGLLRSSWAWLTPGLSAMILHMLSAPRSVGFCASLPSQN